LKAILYNLLWWQARALSQFDCSGRFSHGREMTMSLRIRVLIALAAFVVAYGIMFGVFTILNTQRDSLGYWFGIGLVAATPGAAWRWTRPKKETLPQSN
jgi:hypothetical protein